MARPQVTISRKQFLKWAGWGSAGVVTAVVASPILAVVAKILKKPPSISVAKPKYIKPTKDGEKVAGLPLWTVKFETVTVDARGKVVKRDSNRQVKFFKEELGNGVNLDMVSIPGGIFTMGAPEEEGNRGASYIPERNDSERPQHKVTVKPFLIGKFEVTQVQWKAIASLPKVKVDLELDPSSFKGDNLPVERISWDEAVEFCQRLSKATGREYRLPSEAEWEYACRAGTTTPYYFGETITGELANYLAVSTYAKEPTGEYREKTTPVGSFSPNAFGLYDMHGNVWEWCKDDSHSNYYNYNGAPTDGSVWISGSGSEKIMRGGSWSGFSAYCRSAYRGTNLRDDRDGNNGFRTVCVVGRTT